jgi:hypothetical protein
MIYSSTWPAPSRGRAFSLPAIWAALNSPLIIENALRARGIITEGYDPVRDVYERTLRVGGLNVPLKRMSFAHLPKPNTTLIRVYRPGVSLKFSGMDDLMRRLDRLSSHPGYVKYPNAPWLVENLRNKEHKFIPAERIASAIATRNSLYVPLLQAA